MFNTYADASYADVQPNCEMLSQDHQEENTDNTLFKFATHVSFVTSNTNNTMLMCYVNYLNCSRKVQKK